MVNWAKFIQLSKNGALPMGGAAFVFWLAFGFGWWILPLSILIGAGSSLIATTPNNLMLPEDNRYSNLALKEAELDKELNGM